MRAGEEYGASSSPVLQVVGTAHAGRDVALTHVQLPALIPSADEIFRKLLGPATEAIGDQFAEFVRSRFTEKDASNVKKHIDAVAGPEAELSSDDLSGQQRRKLLEWAENASSVDPDKSEVESAAWQAALEDIIRTSEFQMLDLVKQLNKDELNLLLDIDNGIYVVSAATCQFWFGHAKV